MRACAGLFLVLLAGCGGGDRGTSSGSSGGSEHDAGTPHTGPHTWHTSGGALRDPDGRTVVLRGVNLANAHKAPPYFGFHTAADVARIRTDWGMNAIRLLVEWAAVEPTEGTYDDAYLDALRTRVDWAEQANLSVVVDMHQDVYGEGFGGDGAPRWTCDASEYAAFVPASAWYLNYAEAHVIACYDQFWQSDSLRAHYAAAWKKVAARLADSPAVVGFDPMNEPYLGSMSPADFDRDALGPLYADVVAAVREVAPDWVAFVEPGSTRNLGIPTSLRTPAYPNVVYAPHAYDATAEQGSGFDPSRRGAYLANVAALRGEADHLGAALWIGEYGGVATAPGIVDYMDAAYDAAASVAAGSAYWSYDRDEGYGMLDTAGDEKPELVGVLVRPYPERVAGTLVSFAFDDSTHALTVDCEPAESGTTVISIAPRLVPNDYDVACGGCTFTKSPGQLTITKAPAGKALTIRITPR